MVKKKVQLIKKVLKGEWLSPLVSSEPVLRGMRS